MAIIATWFNWVLLAPNVRTRIAQGPMLGTTIFWYLEFALVAPTAPVNVAWTLEEYHAGPPFYNQQSDVTKVFDFLGTPPAPFIRGTDAAFLPFRSSPWSEFIVRADRPIWVNLVNTPA